MSDPMPDDPLFPEAELARLADGSLTPERAAQLRREIAADPELRAALAEQERAVARLRAIDVPPRPLCAARSPSSCATPHALGAGGCAFASRFRRP